MVQVEGGAWLGHLAVLGLTAVVGRGAGFAGLPLGPAVREQSAVRERPGHRSAFPEWLYLVFLVFLFLGPVFNPDSTAIDWVVAAVTAVVCAVIFMIAIRYSGFRTPAAAVLLVVGVASTGLGSAAMGVVPIYSAALVAGFVSRRVLVWRLGFITLLTVVAMAVSPIPPPFVFLAFGPALPLIWLIGFSVEADIGLSRETISLRAENARVQYLATVTERERIARDLHDLAGQALTAIALRSQLVQRLAETDPRRAIEEAAAIEATARETLASVRETVAGWQQVALTDELDKAITALKVAGVEPQHRGTNGARTSPRRWRPFSPLPCGRRSPTSCVTRMPDRAGSVSTERLERCRFS